MLKKTKTKLVALGTMLLGVSIYYTTELIRNLRKSIDVDVDITNEDVENNLGI